MIAFSSGAVSSIFRSLCLNFSIILPNKNAETFYALKRYKRNKPGSYAKMHMKGEENPGELFKWTGNNWARFLQ